jgi:hypothetical protein
MPLAACAQQSGMPVIGLFEQCLADRVDVISVVVCAFNPKRRRRGS